MKTVTTLPTGPCADMPEINPTVAVAIQTILNELNGGNRNRIVESIYQAVSHDHRTIQQLFWSAMLMAQIKYASNSYDARNEQSVILANMVRELAMSNDMDMGLMYL